VAGKTNFKMPMRDLKPSDSGTYSVTVSRGSEQATATATMTVKPIDLTVRAAFDPDSVREGFSTALQASFSGNPTSLVLKHNGQSIDSKSLQPGSSSFIWPVEAAELNQGGRWEVEIKRACKTKTVPLNLEVLPKSECSLKLSSGSRPVKIGTTVNLIASSDSDSEIGKVKVMHGGSLLGKLKATVERQVYPIEVTGPEAAGKWTVVYWGPNDDFECSVELVIE
jgi:hypothetical protein